MNWLCIPGWATSPDIFDPIIPDKVSVEAINLNFFNEGDFPEIHSRQIDGIICYSLGSLLALRQSVKKIIFIGGFSYFPGKDKKRKLKINLMIRGLRKDHEKVLKDFYTEAGLQNQDFDNININNLIQGLELLRDCDMSHALRETEAEIITIHGKQDCIVPEDLNRMQFKNTKNFSLDGNHGIITSKAEELKSILSEIM